MTDTVETRLRAMGIELPTPVLPAANYLPYVLVDTQLFLSGQLPIASDGSMHKGKLGADFSVEQGQAAARACAINVLAQAKAAIGDLERVRQCMRLTGFVNATADFAEQAAVINGASDLMGKVFGECGRHTRAAVGCASLPFGAAVEIDAIFIVEAA